MALDKFTLEMWNETKEGKKKIEYYNRFGSEPLGHLIGGPDTSAYGDDLEVIIDVCLKKGVTWEELFNYEHMDNVVY